MTGGTDGKQFGRLGMACYGFTPLVLPADYDFYAMFHGVDERIPLSALDSGVESMDSFLRSALRADAAMLARSAILDEI
jgi:acetylornithine deacetylase/succinyl-diaminopimelate desuccinylase-like protein